MMQEEMEETHSSISLRMRLRHSPCHGRRRHESYIEIIIMTNMIVDLGSNTKYEGRRKRN
jgi:hypothetical protein